MKYLIYLFFAFCFFPYIDVLHLGTDTQPNALLLGAFLLFGFKDKKLNTPIIYLWILFGLSILLFLTSKLGTFDSIKTCLNYLSPAIVCFAGFTIFDKTQFRISFRFFMICVSMYFIVGFVQTYFITDFMSFLLNDNARGIMFGGRGAVSLCPEPAFYGSMCLFFMVFSLIYFDKKQNYIIIPFLLFQLFVLSKTATGIGLLLMAFAIFSVVQLLRLKFKPFVLLLFIGLSGNLVVNHMLSTYEDSRVASIAKEFINDPLLIAQVDASASVRFTGTFAPFLSMRHNYFLPMGLGRYPDFLTQLYHEGRYLKLLTRRTLWEKDKLGGSINMVLFHLGFLGLLFPIAIYLAFKGLIHNDYANFALILFICLLFSQIQLMNAFIGFIIAAALIKSKELNLKKESPSPEFV